VRAVLLDEERRLDVREWPDPVPGEGQTLVEVRAAGVNYADVLIR
jgi:NADPH:quinone reductase-like Zn-dependent oxidoreductase